MKFGAGVFNSSLWNGAEEAVAAVQLPTIHFTDVSRQRYDVIDRAVQRYGADQVSRNRYEVDPA